MSTWVTSALDTIWQNCVTKYVKPNEREFLRALHSTSSLTNIKNALNADLRSSGSSISVAITSVWVDHTPQCWFLPIPTYFQVNKSKEQTSCELADLLVVVWDGPTKQTGTAWLLQGKLGRTYNKIAARGSTKIERHLLETGPAFLLSQQTGVGRSHTVNPLGSKHSYCLNYLTAKKRYAYSDFLQIKHADSKRWNTSISPFQVVWPLSGANSSFGCALFDMVANAKSGFGLKFKRNNMSDDWDALVNVLLDETIATSKTGTAKGALQNTAQFSLYSNGPIVNPVKSSRKGENGGAISLIEVVKEAG